MKDLTPLQYQHDDLINSLNQIDALLTLAANVDITEIKPEIMLNYLSVIIDITHRARKNFEKLIDRLPKDVQ